MKKTKLNTRIIAGKYKGKLLQLPSLETTRSSKSILKESFFNRLQFDVIDATFVELFGGSGSIGLEALSRGAEKIYFFEKDPKSFAVLKANINALDPNSCQAFNADVFTVFETLLIRLKEEGSKAYFYIDPPFSIREGMETIYDQMIDLIEKIPTERTILITIEHMSDLKLPEVIGPYCCTKQKKFGKTSLSYFEVEKA